ncbi:MAG: hypothetical protein LBS21_04955 [Clostridiales bacterium]|nr:hypothetical protein [Clostridiales bacterium]
MVEIYLIVMCIIAANRFRAAGEKGVGKYIGGVWGCIGGGFILAVLFRVGFRFV